MNKYSIIACDLDGTLLEKGTEVSHENYQAIHEMKTRGIEFVPTTGRAFYEMPEHLRECPDIRYYLNSNGSEIFDKKTGESVLFGIKEETLSKIMDIVEKYKIYMSFHADGYCCIDGDKDIFEYQNYCHMSNDWVRFVNFYGRPQNDFNTFVRTRKNAEMFCIFFETEDIIKDVTRELENVEGIKISSSDKYNIEIFSSECGKGRSLLALANMLNVPYDKTIAVGDSLNDISMFESAGLSIAVNNAKSELKKIADVVGCSNTEHIARFILENIV